MSKTIEQFPDPTDFQESKYELDYIRRKLSGLFEYKIELRGDHLGMLRLILCLSNEIAELKEKLNIIENNK